MNDIIIHLIIIVCLPIIPAFIFYKFLPGEGKTFAKGPFKGLNIQLTGAFAGYFVVLLFSGGLFFTLNSQIQEYDFHDVVGHITLDQGDFDEKEFLVAVTPPRWNILDTGTKGQLSIYDLPFSKKENRPPHLLIKKDGYDVKTVIIESLTNQNNSEADYEVTFDRKKGFIIKNIILRKKTDVPYYSIENAENPIKGEKR